MTRQGWRRPWVLGCFAIGALLLAALLATLNGTPFLTTRVLLRPDGVPVMRQDGTTAMVQEARMMAWATKRFADGAKGFRTTIPGPVWARLVTGERIWLRQLVVRGEWKPSKSVRWSEE